VRKQNGAHKETPACNLPSKKEKPRGKRITTMLECKLFSLSPSLELLGAEKDALL